jgi:transcriptional regulator with XRE-family HTH domain
MSGPGWLLRRERRRRGWSYGTTANRLRETAVRMGLDAEDVDAAEVERWETPGAGRIRFRHLKLLAETFQIPVTDLLGLTDAGERREWLVLAQAGSKMGSGESTDAMLRREFLRYTAALMGAGTFDAERLAYALLNLRHDPRLVADLEALTESYGAAVWRKGPGELLPTLRGHLVMLRRLLIGATPPADARLLAAASHTALLLSRLEWERQEDRTEAEHHWQLAERLARMARAADLQAAAMIQSASPLSGVPHWSDGVHVQDAIAVLTEALDLIPADHHHLRLWGYVRRAQERARIGQGRDSDRDLDSAARELAAGGAGTGFHIAWDQARLDGYRGGCAVWLGRSRGAIDILERSLWGTPPAFVSQRAAVLADLGAAHACAHEVDAACEWLTESLTLSHRAGLAEKVQRIVGVRVHYLNDHVHEPAVQRLDEQILAVRQA